MGHEPLVISAGSGTTVYQGDDEVPVRTLSREGNAFRLEGDTCSSLTLAAYDESVSEQESVDTSGD